MTVGVGIVGLSATRGWAGTAHVPALRRVPGLELRALAASSPASARAAAAAHGVTTACGSAEELAARDDVDLVVVTVRVPHHLELVTAALDAGKMVLCEWPLGLDTAEAEAMAAAAERAGVRAWVGLQARSAPTVRLVRDLVASGSIGEVLSTTVVGSGLQWGPAIASEVEYLRDAACGATLLTIPFGHALDGVAWALGEPERVSGVVTTRRTTVRHTATGELVPMTSPDHVAVSGVLAGGAVLSMAYRGGAPAGPGFLWEVHGSSGDLVITGTSGHLQYGLVTVARGGERREPEPLEVPDELVLAPGDPGDVSSAVAEAYAGIVAEIEGGPATVPTFADAVRRHRTLDAIVAASASGTTQILP